MSENPNDVYVSIFTMWNTQIDRNLTATQIYEKFGRSPSKTVFSKSFMLLKKVRVIMAHNSNSVNRQRLYLVFSVSLHAMEAGNFRFHCLVALM